MIQLILISHKDTIKMKIRLLILLFILISFVLSSCSPSPYSYTYPKEYSAEYCFEQYELFDPNIVYSECYEFVSEKNWGGNISFNFSAIKDCEDLSFMVCYKKHWLLGSGYSIQVVRSKDSDINPSRDYTPLRAELFWYNESWSAPDTENAEKYHCYDSQCLSQTVMPFDSMETIDEIMKIASRNAVLSYDEFLEEQNTTIDQSELRGIYTEDGALYVKVYFTECEGLVFIGKIMIDDSNNSYMQHIVYYCNDYKDAIDLKASSVRDGDTWRFYYRLGENMDAIISELIEELSGS